MLKIRNKLMISLCACLMFYVFISGSAVHIKWMDIQKDMVVRPIQLKKLSDTRWSCQYGMCQTIIKRLEAILRLLEYIEATDEVRERAYEARCLLGSIDQNFCILLECLTEILRHCKSASDFSKIPITHWQMQLMS